METIVSFLSVYVILFDHSLIVAVADTCGILRAVRPTIYSSGLLFFVNPELVNFMEIILCAGFVIGLMTSGVVGK